MSHDEASSICSSCKISRAALCPIYPAIKLDLVERYRRIRTYEPDAVVLGEGRTADFIGIIIEGVLRSSLTTSSGKQEVVGLHAQGSMFCHFFGGSTKFDIEASTRAQVCTLQRRDVQRHLATDLGFQAGVIMALTRELAAATEIASITASHKPSERLARFCLAVTSPEAAGQLTIRFPFNRRDIAALLKTSPETISRFMRRLASKNIVEPLSKASFRIEKLESLEELAGRTLAVQRCTTLQTIERNGLAASLSVDDDSRRHSEQLAAMAQFRENFRSSRSSLTPGSAP